MVAVPVMVIVPTAAPAGVIGRYDQATTTRTRSMSGCAEEQVMTVLPVGPLRQVTVIELTAWPGIRFCTSWRTRVLSLLPVTSAWVYEMMAERAPSRAALDASDVWNTAKPRSNSASSAVRKMGSTSAASTIT